MKDKVNYNNYHVLTMLDFLSNYVGLEQSELISLIGANHYDIEELNIPGVHSIPREYITDADILSGRVLLVTASGFKKSGSMIRGYERPSLVLARTMQKNGLETSDIDDMYVDSYNAKVRERKINND